MWAGPWALPEPPSVVRALLQAASASEVDGEERLAEDVSENEAQVPMPSSISSSSTSSSSSSSSSTSSSSAGGLASSVQLGAMAIVPAAHKQAAQM